MSHAIDGYELRFTARTSWKAERRARGTLIDIVPVTWTHGRRGNLQEVWYRNQDELERALQSTHPFVIALAQAKNPLSAVSEFLEFRGVFEVVGTGRRLSDQSIETKVLRRLNGSEQ